MTWLTHLTWIVHLTSCYPLVRAWRASRQTTLTQALGWAAAAWLWWLLADLAVAFGVGTSRSTLHYLALCLTGCAGVAVLGARRPGAGAWSFVLVGLLAVQLLQVAEGIDLLRYSPLREVFLGATLAVGMVNYLPTRLGPGAVCLALGCATEFARLLQPENEGPVHSLIGGPAVAIAPWLGMAALRLFPEGQSEFDRTWLGFRDRFGFIWAQRMREQFNRAAVHAGWPSYLLWGGLRHRGGQRDETTQAEMLKALRALLKRFGPESMV